ARSLPRLATITRALDDLAKPATRLRCIDPVRIGGRSFDVINLPASKMRAAGLPILPLAVPRQNKRAFARTNQYSYFAHPLLLSNLGSVCASLTAPGAWYGSKSTSLEIPQNRQV